MSYTQRQIYATGLFLFLVPTLIFTLSSLILLVKLPLFGNMFPISFVVATFLTHRLSMDKDTLISVKAFLYLIIGSGLMFLSFWISGWFYDVSFDGQWYHQDAILFFSKGWNPYYDPLLADGVVSGNNANYVNHYPKATWIYQSIVYLFFGSIELGKALHLQLILSFGLLLFSFLSTKTTLSTVHRVFLVLIAIATPITMGQIFSFYVDGVLYCFLGLFLVFLIKHVVYQEGRHWELFFSFLFLVNIKFTGLVYALLFAFAAFLYLMAIHKESLKGYVVRFSAIAFCGIFLFGFPTYGRNLIEKKHVFFPIMGENNEGLLIAQAQYPKDFYPLNRFEKFFRAHGAIPNYTANTHPSLLKEKLFQPGFIRSSIPYYRNHQPVTMSPFGPFELELWVLFSLSIILFFIYVRNWKIYLLLGFVLFSLLVQPEFWNLRYAPQLLWMILVVQGALLVVNNRLVRFYSAFFCVLFMGNGMIASKENWGWVSDRNGQLKSKLMELSNRKVVIHPGWMNSFNLKLNDYDVKPSAKVGDPKKALEFYEGDFTGWKYNEISE